MAVLVMNWPASAEESCNNLKKEKISLSPQCSPRSSVSFTVWWERFGVRRVRVHFQTVSRFFLLGDEAALHSVHLKTANV